METIIRDINKIPNCARCKWLNAYLISKTIKAKRCSAQGDIDTILMYDNENCRSLYEPKNKG